VKSTELANARALVREATELRLAQRFSESAERYRAALVVLRRELGDHVETALASGWLGHVLHTAGRTAESIPLSEEALAMGRRLIQVDHPYLLLGMDNLAQAYVLVGRPVDALALNEEALAMRQRMFSANHAEVLKGLTNLVQTYVTLGRHAEAHALAKDVLERCRRTLPPDHEESQRALSNVALTLMLLGRHAEAVAPARALLEELRRIHTSDHVELAGIIGGVGELLAEVGDRAEARALVEESLAMHRRLFPDGHDFIAAGVAALGMMQHEAGERTEALASMRAAADMAEQVGSNDIAMRLTMYGRLLSAEGRDAEAVVPLQRAVEHHEAARSHGRSLGALQRMEYVNSLRRLDPYTWLATAQRGAGRLDASFEAVERGRAREMIGLLERSQVDPLAEARARAAEAGDRSTLAAFDIVGSEIADLERAVATRVQAERSARATGDFAAVRAAREESVRVRRALLDALGRQARLVRDAHPVSTPLGLAEVQALLAPDERLLSYVLGEGLSFVFVVSPPGIPSASILLRDAGGRNATEGTIADLARRFAAACAKRVPGSIETEHAEATRTLGAELYGMLVPPEVWALVRGQRRVYVVCHGALHGVPFEALVTGAREGRTTHWLDEGPPIAYVASGSVLAWLHARTAEQRAARAPLSLAAVGDPVFADPEPPSWPTAGVLVTGARPGGQADTLGIRPGDVLTTYGDTTIQDGATLRKAVEAAMDQVSIVVKILRGEEKVEVLVRPGLLGIDIAHAPPSVAGPALLARGPLAVALRAATDRARPLRPLPGTRKEVESLRRLILDAGAPEGQVRILLGSDATEARWTAIAPGARYVHIATHGLVDETDTTSFSALALSMPHVPVPGDDGFLSLLDLLSRWRTRLRSAELVVLSACDTQRGRHTRGEGVLALPWGFHAAGAPSVVGTLWQVEDATAATTMESMYRALLARDGQDRLGALVEAKRALRATHPQPFHWAPYVFLGDPR
jgi:tetratricopeptide (TPR) repeat protein